MIDWFARPKQNALSPSELNPEGRGHALVLRYAGCQLRQDNCPLCYARRYAWNIKNGHEYEVDNVLKSLSRLQEHTSRKIVWVRVQGGEPLLTYDRSITTLNYAEKALSQIIEKKLNFYGTTRVVIQTNSLGMNRLNEEQLAELSRRLEAISRGIGKQGRIVFEVSLKSSMNLGILAPQIKGFDLLLRLLIPLWKKGFDNLAVYPLAGLG
ncbi:MAG: radical SAM protein [Candidatus Bathyarchaeia archaeon]